MEPTWQTDDGSVALYLADCLDVLPTLSGVDCAITSPPYNCGMDYGCVSDSLPLKTYWSLIEDVSSGIAGSLALHGYQCVNHPNFIGSREGRVYAPDEMRPILDRHLQFVDLIIWDKGPANGAAWGNFRTSPRIRAQHELIYVHKAGGSQMPPSDIEWSDWSKFTTSIWSIPASGIDLRIHPAMMPEAIARRLASLYSPAGGTVLDPFMGSGTTGVACVRLGRRFIGIEKEEKYYRIAQRRIQDALGMETADKSGLVQRRMFTPFEDGVSQ